MGSTVLPLNKRGVGDFFCRVESIDLALNKREWASAACSTEGKRRSRTKQAKDDVGGYSYRVGSVSLLNK